MKKLYIYLLAITILASCSNNETINKKIESDVSKENLKGNVASVSTKSQIAILDNGEIKTAGFGGRNNSLNNNLKKYNKAGFCIEELRYSKNGSASKFENIHDKNGNLIERRAFQPEDKAIFTLNYSYDKNGNNIKTKRIDINGNVSGHWIKKFDENGYLVEYTDMESDSSVRYIIKYNNDSLGNVLDRSRYTAEGHQLHQLFYTYDEDYRVVKEVEYYQPIFSHPSYTKLFKYNDKNLPTEEKVINNTRKYETVWKFEYEYDEHENWIHQIQLKNDTAKYIVTRDIVYYN